MLALMDPTKEFHTEIERLCKLANDPMAANFILSAATCGCIPTDEQVISLGSTLDSIIIDALLGKE